MTKQDYLTLVDDYIAGNDETGQKRMILYTKASDYFDKTGKLLADFTQEDLFDFFIFMTETKLFKYRTIIKMYEIADGFYMYLQEREIIKLNPAASVGTTEFAKRVINNAVITMPYYKRADIEKIINSQEKNKTLVSAIMLSYYEGVASTSEELINLKRSDFDYESRTIVTPRGVKEISKTLADAYQDLGDIYVVYKAHPRSNNGHREYPLHPATQGAIIKVATASNNRKNIAQYTSSVLKVIQNEIGTQMDRGILYNEGFLEYLCDKLGEEEVPHLLRGGRKKQSEVNKIEELMKEYKFNASYGKISETLEPYVIALKARYKKFINS